MRLDVYLARYYKAQIPSREKAAYLIKAGLVRVDGKVVKNKAYEVADVARGTPSGMDSTKCIESEIRSSDLVKCVASKMDSIDSSDGTQPKVHSTKCAERKVDSMKCIESKSDSIESVERKVDSTKFTKSKRAKAKQGHAGQARIEILSLPRTSRASYKLEFALNTFGIDLANKALLDVGASKGGFVQLALDRGAARVIAIDVGHGQLDSDLALDPRVLSFEGMDVRAFSLEGHLGVDFLSCDVSFISLGLILEKLLSFKARENLLLFKPQFEVGKGAKRNKKGVVVDKVAIKGALENFKKELHKYGIIDAKIRRCDISGKEGSDEFFIYFKGREI